MTLVKRNPMDSLPGFFDSFLLKDRLDLPEFNNDLRQSYSPAVNIQENENQFELELLAPGLQKESFSIEMNENILTIAFEKENRQEEEEVKGNSRFTIREFSIQSFKRSFRFPLNVVDTEKVKAKYDAGVLKLVLPKKEEVKLKPKQIKVA